MTTLDSFRHSGFTVSQTAPMWDNQVVGVQPMTITNTMLCAPPSGCTPVGGALALGSTDPMDKIVVARFWAKVDRHGPDECWEWLGALGPTGYGRMGRDNKQVRAHRLAWELANGPIPAGMIVCHRCDNPPCVNPGHLFVGTWLDNIRDMDAKGRRGRSYSGRDTCGKGHPYGLDVRRDASGARQCMVCRRAQWAKRRNGRPPGKPASAPVAAGADKVCCHGHVGRWRRTARGYLACQTCGTDQSRRRDERRRAARIVA